MIIPSAPTLAAVFQFRVNTLRSTSSPTKNRNNTRPRLAAKERMGIDAFGKIASM